MSFREQGLGTEARFLLPSLKLKHPVPEGGTQESRLHSFLMENFGGYTAQAGNIFGYWRNADGKDLYGEHREFSVAFEDASKLPVLKNYLAGLATELGEQTIYFSCSGKVSLLSPDAKLIQRHSAS